MSMLRVLFYRLNFNMKKYLRIYIALYKECRKSDTNFFSVVIREIYYRITLNKKIWLHQNVTIKGIDRIETPGRLTVGIHHVGFIHKTDKTYLNINGKLKLQGDYSIGRGCRFDVGDSAVVSIGKGGYINANTKLIIMNELVIGDNCVISWDCQFLDEDFHDIYYDGKQKIKKSIIIGNNVWIGCGVKIYKGTVIPDNCVIASDSVVRGIFTSSNSLLAGSPAKVIKERIEWK